MGFKRPAQHPVFNEFSAWCFEQAAKCREVRLQREAAGYPVQAPACKKCQGRGVVTKQVGGWPITTDCECRVPALMVAAMESATVPLIYRAWHHGNWSPRGDYQASAYGDVRLIANSYRVWLLENGPAPEKWLVLHGARGNGKSHMAWLSIQPCIQPRKTHAAFITWAQLGEWIASATRGNLSPAQRRGMPAALNAATSGDGADKGVILDTVKRIPLLVLDDVNIGENGAEATIKTHSSWLESIVTYRYAALLPTVITTNLAVGDWDQAFGRTVASRLHERARPLYLGPVDGRRADKNKKSQSPSRGLSVAR